MPYMLGIDIGTSGARAILVADDGTIAGIGTAEYPLSHPHPLWSEQNPLDWWEGARTALRDAVTNAGVSKDEIAGLGLTGQMHGAVLLDEQDAPIRPAMLWNDGRTSDQCNEIEDRIGLDRLLAVAGNPALEGFQAPKILWVRQHEPDNWSKIRRVLLPKDYIRLMLTGDAATDVSDASGTLLLDLNARDWSDEILEKLEIPRDWLPRVYEGPEVTGKLQDSIADELGLPRDLPVVAGGGDNAAAAVGTGIVRDGLASASIGTSGVIFAHTDTFQPDPEGKLHAFCHAVPGAYHLMGVTLAAGGSLQWWRNALHPGMDYTEMLAGTLDIEPGSEGLLFLPWLSGERTPYRDPLARGAFIGLTTRHTGAHMTRSVMEGVVLSLRESLDLMRALGVEIDHLRATGGGARHPLWLQLQADIFQTPVRTMTVEEGPAFGAALLAGVGSGVFADVQEASKLAQLKSDTQQPDADRAARYDEVFAIYRDMYAANVDAMHRLSHIDAS